MSAIYRHNQSHIKPSVSDKCIYLEMVSERAMLCRLQRQWQWQWLSSSPPEDESPVPLHTGASSAADAPQDSTGSPCAAVLLCFIYLFGDQASYFLDLWRNKPKKVAKPTLPSTMLSSSRAGCGLCDHLRTVFNLELQPIPHNFYSILFYIFAIFYSVYFKYCTTIELTLYLYFFFIAYASR